jgi:hypothetical protein
VRFAAFMRGLALPKLVDLAYRLLGQEKSLAGWIKDSGRPF